MTDRYQAQAQSLMALSLDDQGQLQIDKVAAVVAGLQQSKISGRAQVFRRYARQVRRTLSAQVAIIRSATELDATTKRSIEQQLLAKRPQIVACEWQTEPSLLGGITVQAGDTWYDLSLKGKLLTIEEHLQS